MKAFDPANMYAMPTNIFADLVDAWGPFNNYTGKAPWDGLKKRQLQVPVGYFPTAMAYCPQTGDCLVVVEREPQKYLFTHWVGAKPAMLEASLKGQVPYRELIHSGAGENGLSVPPHEVNIHEAARVFVTWAIKQTGWKQEAVEQPTEAYW